MSVRTSTIAEGRGEWVIFNEAGCLVTSFPYLAHAVQCVAALLDGAFGWPWGGREGRP